MSFFLYIYLTFFCRFICPVLEMPGLINLDLPLELKRLRFFFFLFVFTLIQYSPSHKNYSVLFSQKPWKQHLRPKSRKTKEKGKEGKKREGDLLESDWGMMNGAGGWWGFF